MMQRSPSPTLFPYTTLFRSRAAKLFGPQELYGAFVHETHHAAKKDAPSGTALLLKGALERGGFRGRTPRDRKSTRLNSSHVEISYAVFCLKKKIGNGKFIHE